MIPTKMKEGDGIILRFWQKKEGIWDACLVLIRNKLALNNLLSLAWHNLTHGDTWLAQNL